MRGNGDERPFAAVMTLLDIAAQALASVSVTFEPIQCKGAAGVKRDIEAALAAVQRALDAADRL